MSYVDLDYPAEHVARITLNRPERLNALSYALLRELHASMDQLEKEPATRVVIMTGAGKGFCAGADLKAAMTGENGNWEEGLGKVQMDYRMQQGYADLVAKMRRIPQPIIGALHGAASGAGMAMALACDMRIGSDTTKFNCSFTKIGLGGAEMGTSYFLPKLVGQAMAAELMYTGRMVEAEEAKQLGLISRAVSEDALMDTALALAGEMVGKASPFGLRVTKEALNQVPGGYSLDAALHLENRNQVLGLQTKDFMTAAMSWSSAEDPDYKDE